MPSTEAPNWWADVQQEREDLAGPGRRPADDWLGEEIDFAPRKRISRREEPTPAADSAVAHPLHGVFVPTGEPRSMTIELGTPAGSADDIVVATPADVAHELRHLHAADDPFATPPPPPGVRRTIAIKGRPGESVLPSLAQRHRPRTASDRVGHRPDRVALWAVVLGAVLILVAATTSSSKAATVPHRTAATPQVHHMARHAPVVHHRATVRLARTQP
jgi:hypothetical protein